MANELEKAEAKKQITKSIRDLLSFKITVPLGNPSYKLIHTNKFITTRLPDDFVLDNFSILGEKLNSEDTRYSGYTRNNWYVEAVTITNDGSSAKMELELNPFASSVTSYKDGYKGFMKAYTDAINQQNQNTNTSTTTKKETKTARTASTGSKTLDKVVDKAIKGKSKPLDKAKAVDKAFKNHVFYSFYRDAQKTGGKKSNFESAWNNAHLNCADGANLLCAMFNYAGIRAVIFHIPAGGASKWGHYIVRVTINGKYYFTDNSANSGKHTTKAFGKVWNGRTKGTNKGTIVT